VMLELLHRAGILTASGPAPADKELSGALRAAITDDAQPGLAANLRQLMRVASNLRERLSIDNWRALNRLTQAVTQRRGRKTAFSDLLTELDLAISGFTTLSGFALDGMTRDPGWRFLSIGRRLERLQWLCTTLKLTVAGPAEMDLTWLLRLADSIITYRARYMARPEWLPVLDLLIRDEANPRSIAFQVHGLRDYAQRLVDLFGDFGDEHFHGALRGLLQIDPVDELQPGSERLIARLDEWQAAAYRHGEQLGLRFFSHVGEASSQTFAT
ncbi:MAG: alpha-E domain-containing protein, partial [Betaproteobacteria bacterium]|nr:alpha-E domain-containing protein [Betaproteobacteria bacterium]